MESPTYKMNVIVSTADGGHSAWVQLGKFDNVGSLAVVAEGWVAEGAAMAATTIFGAGLKASLARATNVSADALKCQQDARFGALACCTAYGNGCYVRCCNSCCSDPYRCPGASCCG